jgi:sterol desaturase/sphingolipid hydroxylase (fatty acid hydroxylase superfamily)
VIEFANQILAAIQGWIFETLVQPAMFNLGLAAFIEDAYDGTEWFILGVVEIVILYALLRPLEAWRPAERWADRKATRTDVLYTLLNRLGLLPLLFFMALMPLETAVQGWLRMHDIIPPNLEDLLPALDGRPLLSFLVYLLIIDLAEYWRHRLQHRYDAWWALHSLHHSQRQLSFWSDNRNHLLDDLIAGAWIAAVALLIGVPPGHFVTIVIATRMIESLSHANVRVSFGRIGERLLVSPRFHRFHHAIGEGHEGAYQGCNFAVLFPLWDIVFRTARFDPVYLPTGIRDQLRGRNYGKGFLSQQVLGLKRLAESLNAAKSGERGSPAASS